MATCPLALNQFVGEPQRVDLPPLAEAYWTGEHHAQVTRTMTPQLAELIGYFMGDGSLQQPRPPVLCHRRRPRRDPAAV